MLIAPSMMPQRKKLRNEVGLRPFNDGEERISWKGSLWRILVTKHLKERMILYSLFFLVDFSLPGIFVAQLLDVLEVSISSKPLAILVLKLCLAAVQRNSLDCNAGIHIHQRLPFGHQSSFMVVFGVLVSNIRDRAHFCNSCMCPTNNGALRLKLRRYLSPWKFFQVLQFGNCGHFWPGTFELGGS